MSHFSRASLIKVLGVTISNKLSVSDHITNIISKCSQTLYALTIIRAHGLCDVALQSVYRSVVTAMPLVPGGGLRRRLPSYVEEFAVVSVLLTCLSLMN